MCDPDVRPTRGILEGSYATGRDVRVLGCGCCGKLLNGPDASVSRRRDPCRDHPLGRPQPQQYTSRLMHMLAPPRRQQRTASSTTTSSATSCSHRANAARVGPTAARSMGTRLAHDRCGASRGIIALRVAVSGWVSTGSDNAYTTRQQQQLLLPLPLHRHVEQQQRHRRSGRERRRATCDAATSGGGQPPALRANGAERAAAPAVRRRRDPRSSSSFSAT
eukprot:1227646-Prymnesium_polylepis.1